jgi:hypothetical protein
LYVVAGDKPLTVADVAEVWPDPMSFEKSLLYTSYSYDFAPSTMLQASTTLEFEGAALIVEGGDKRGGSVVLKIPEVALLVLIETVTVAS